MYAFIETIGEIIGKIYSILDVQLFPDFPVTYMQMILVSFVIVFILRFMFGGMKEVNGVENLINATSYSRIPNVARQKNLNREHINNLVTIANDKEQSMDFRDWAVVELNKMGRSFDGKRYK